MPRIRLDRLVFVGFNSRVAAIDRDTGELVWTWKCPKGSGYVAVLVDGDRLIASVNGYTYCLAPHDGSQLWENPLEGLGVGVPCVASARGSTAGQSFRFAAADEEAASSSAAAAGAGGAAAASG
jgi:outer membrane protein assembly factor BamB